MKNRRLELKMTQKTLAMNVGISKSYVSKMENKKCTGTVNFGIIKNIAKELSLCPCQVFSSVANLECHQTCHRFNKKS